MRIAQISPLWTQVPPETYGGIERIVHILCEELVARDHEVHLFAAGDAQTRATLHPACDVHITEKMQKGEAYDYEHYMLSNMVEAIKLSSNFDIIHCHGGCHYLSLGELSSCPMLHTIRTLITPDDHWLIEKYPHSFLSAISHSQRNTMPDFIREKVPVIYNGINFSECAHPAKPLDYMFFLGRMGIAKNPLGAIEIARRLNIPIILAGKAEDAQEQLYFQEKIKPLIDHQKVIHVGPVNQDQKNQFFKNAMALLFPIQWDEPFGNVMVEAMACGTPVVAFKRGSVSEVIDWGKTGFYGDTLDELVSLVPKALELDRTEIRQHAMYRFNHRRMVDDYLQAYQSIISSKSKN